MADYSESPLEQITEVGWGGLWLVPTIIQSVSDINRFIVFTATNGGGAITEEVEGSKLQKIWTGEESGTVLDMRDIPLHTDGSTVGYLSDETYPTCEDGSVNGMYYYPSGDLVNSGELPWVAVSIFKAVGNPPGAIIYAINSYTPDTINETCDFDQNAPELPGFTLNEKINLSDPDE